MGRILTWLIDSSVISSIIILIILVMRPLLKKLPKWVNMVLWLIVAVRLVMPVGPESSFSLVPDIDGLRVAYTEMLFDDEASKGRNYENDVIYEKASETDVINLPDEYPVKELKEEDDIVKAPAPDVKKNTFEALEGSKQGIDAVGVVFIIWIVGFAAAFSYFVLSYLKLKKLVRFSVPAELPFNITERSLAYIYVCEGIRSPFIMGMLGTKLYIPEGMDEKTLEYVIIHENAHIRHFDQVWKVIGFILLMIYWFNPFAWIAFICFTKDMELACDERAVGNLSPEERAGYSEALLECSVHNRLLAICPVAFGETGVKTRVKAVIKMKKPLKIVLVCVALGCAVFALCFLTNPISVKSDTETENKEVENTDIENGSIGFTEEKTIDKVIETLGDDSDKTVNEVENFNGNGTLAINETDDENSVQQDSVRQNSIQQDMVKGATDLTDATGFDNETSSDKSEQGESVTDSVAIDGIGTEMTKDEMTGQESVVIDSDNDFSSGISSEVSVASVPSSENAVIPYGITKIKNNAFAGTETIRSISIPESVEIIGDGAFFKCMNLQEAVIPGSVTEIGVGAFEQCESLRKVQIPSSVKKIGNSAFAFCSIEELIIPDGAKEWGDYVFALNYKLQRVEFPKDMTEIPKGFLNGCLNLSEVYLGDRLECIGTNAFYGCENLKQISIPDTVSRIGYGAFQNTGLKEVWIPDGVELIEAYSFYGCKDLVKVHIPDSVKCIEEEAFACCENLKDINIPDNVIDISESAFRKCNKLPGEIKDKIRSVKKSSHK